MEPNIPKSTSDADLWLEPLCYETASISRSIAMLCREIERSTLITTQDIQNYIQKLSHWNERLRIVEFDLSTHRAALMDKRLLMPVDRKTLSRLDMETAKLHQLSKQLADLLSEVMAWDEEDPPLQV